MRSILDGVMYLAGAEDLSRHRGTVLAIEQSVFAPSAMLMRDHENGVVGPVEFERRYLWELRTLWKRDRSLFTDLLDLASAGDVTLVDDWGDAEQAPRRILARALKRVAQERDRQRRLVANAADLDADGPVAPP